MYTDGSLETMAGGGVSSPVVTWPSSVVGRAVSVSATAWLTLVFFLRIGTLSLGEEEAERVVAAAGALLFLPVVFVALHPVVASLGLRIRWMLVLKETAVIFPEGWKSVVAFFQSTYVKIVSIMKEVGRERVRGER